MTYMVTIYSKENCINCLKTQAWFLSNDIEFEHIDITKDSNALEHVQKLRYQELPVVFIDENTHWSGHRVDRLEETFK